MHPRGPTSALYDAFLPAVTKSAAPAAARTIFHAAMPAISAPENDTASAAAPIRPRIALRMEPQERCDSPVAW